MRPGTQDSASPRTLLSVFLFTNANLSKCQWSFTKLDMCIDSVDIVFDIATGHISSIF